MAKLIKKRGKANYNRKKFPKNSNLLMKTINFATINKLT